MGVIFVGDTAAKRGAMYKKTPPANRCSTQMWLGHWGTTLSTDTPMTSPPLQKKEKDKHGTYQHNKFKDKVRRTPLTCLNTLNSLSFREPGPGFHNFCPALEIHLLD